MIERPVGLAEQVGPLLAQVEVPVVLAGDEDLLDLHLLQELVPEVELDGIAQLGEVAAVDEEIRGRLHGLDLLHCPHRLVHEARVDVFREEVAVGDPGELERRRLSSRLSEREIERADEREPPIGGHAGSPGQQGFVEENAAGDPERSGSFAAALQRLVQLNPLSLILVHGLPSKTLQATRSVSPHFFFCSRFSSVAFFSSIVCCAASLAFTVTGTSAGSVASCQATSVYEPGGTSGIENVPSFFVTA